MGRRAAGVTVWLLVLLSCDVVLIGPVTVLEVVVGAAGALLAAIAADAVRVASGAAPGGARYAVRAVLAWPGALLTETWQLARAVLGARRARGGFGQVRLPEGVGTAWASAVLSATPGAYVVAFGDEDDRVLTVHRLGDRPSGLERALGVEEARA
ncbi:Na+/H+ antiporter subunit E [Streptomyces sp. MI02-7b]|uniref:Na+/H+ antiporter subunit E n=1 Tax=Streptomyces sp. MI02-7b TaxID=462941 RepID=UPI0029A76302|nr:Na+/H+ antiporter subunit E [Streptomyces sp. MI02-7b]MDX3076222.1 Na+/H+ antiporter subunit E [Streptomyces sp. MI02-7b]